MPPRPPAIRSRRCTAPSLTPARMRSASGSEPRRTVSNGGLLHEGDDTWFTSMPVHVGIRDLTPQWLAPLVGLLTAHDIDVSDVRTRAGRICHARSQPGGLRGGGQCRAPSTNSARWPRRVSTGSSSASMWPIAASSMRHSRSVASRAELLLGETHTGRAPRRPGALPCRCRAGPWSNCEVATTGFDIPTIDCIAMLRPTQSPRGCACRCSGVAPGRPTGKLNCLVLDFAGNIERHTPLDELTRSRRVPRSGGPGSG